MPVQQAPLLMLICGKTSALEYWKPTCAGKTIDWAHVLVGIGAGIVPLGDGKVYPVLLRLVVVDSSKEFKKRIRLRSGKEIVICNQSGEPWAERSRHVRFRVEGLERTCHSIESGCRDLVVGKCCTNAARTSATGRLRGWIVNGRHAAKVASPHRQRRHGGKTAG